MPRRSVAVGTRCDKDQIQANQTVQTFWKPRKLQEAIFFNRVDLCISGDFDIPRILEKLSINKIGAPLEGKICEGIIYRIEKDPLFPVNYPYLTVSDRIGESADVITIHDFMRAKNQLKKKIRKGTGLEVTIAPARKMNAATIGRWFESIRNLHSFSQSSKCQLVLSSGATSMHGMVSGLCFDAILRTCGIDPERHWSDMDGWLEAKLSRRVTIA